ncbi:putative polyglutamate biosynthesis protein, partial [Myriangium duriaei CBS 260.36]
MLGRLIDQLFPIHVDEPSEAAIVRNVQQRDASLHLYDNSSPWGNWLPVFKSADLTLINLETSATTHARKWPAKVFNYRMHPENIASLTTAGVSYAGLANNHTLDFCEQGLSDTVAALRKAQIPFAGAGDTREEALAPAVLSLGSHEVHVYAASDHPADWSKVPNFHLIDYGSSMRQQLKETLLQRPRPGLKIFSVHWGPNYAWQPADELQRLARFLVDECEVDVIHGHSSHHVQGVEVYKGKPIIYGCGDFVDDYAVVDGGWRNDLSALWRLNVREMKSCEQTRLAVSNIEVFPNRIQNFVAHRLDAGDKDHKWVLDKVRHLSSGFGTRARSGLGRDGQLVFNI